MDEGSTVPLWEQLARQWARLGPPLRPSDEDVATAQSVVDEYARRTRGRAGTALILGVTPELRSLRWPVGIRVLAADLSLGMIRGVGQRAGTAAAGGWLVQGDWCRLPLADASCDLAFGDACLAQLRACRATAVLHETARALAPGGTLAMRLFLRPDVDETP